MILHIGNNDKKFILPFLDNLKSHHSYVNHTMIIISSKKVYDFFIYPNVIYISKYRDILTAIKLINKADKLIFHSMFLPVRILVLIFFMSKKNYFKSYWMIWGGDLYNRFWDRKDSTRNYMKYIFTKFFARRIKNIISVVDGDYNFAVEHYKTKAYHLKMALYPNSTNISYVNDSNKNKIKFKILVGNSATKSNLHIQVFEKLSNFTDIEIYCPLSYGNDELRDKVVRKGKEIFDKSFHPITEFMQINEYHNFLRSVDIAIFNHKRQQALGNIITLLAMGKKIYLNKESPVFSDFSLYGFKIFDVDSINSEVDLLKFNKNDSLNNHDLYKIRFGLENYNNKWSKVYSNNTNLEKK